MSLLAAVILLSTFQDPPLADETRFDSVGIAVRFPQGWVPAKVEASTSIAKVQAPPGSLASGDCLLVRIEGDEAMTTKTFAASLLDSHQKGFPGLETISQDDLAVAGIAARRFLLHWKDLSVWKVCLARTPLVLVCVDFTCATTQEAAGRALCQRVVDSIRFYPPVLGAGLGKAEERSRVLLRQATLPAQFEGDTHYLVLLGDKAIGRWKVTLRPAKVREKAGYELESVMTLPDGAAGTRSDTVKGAFLMDGSYQRMEAERLSERPERGRRLCRTLAVIEGNKLTASRVIDGENVETVVDLPEGTYLNDFGDIVRSVLVRGGKEVYALRRIDPFNNLPSIEEHEVTAAEFVKVGGGERKMITVLSKVDDRRHLIYRFEEDGRWESVRVPGTKVEIRRCTAGEYEKAK